MARIWLIRGLYPGNGSMVSRERSGSYTLSVCRVLVTVLGTTRPRRILPKGTHITGPSTRGWVGSRGTPFSWVMRSTMRCMMEPEGRLSTSLPGYIRAMVSCRRRCAARQAASARSSLAKGSFNVVARFCISTRGWCISTNHTGRSLCSAGTKPCRSSASFRPSGQWPSSGAHTP